MPSAALHSHYWQQDWQEAPVVAGGGGRGGYVHWQMNTLGCGFGFTQVAWDWLLHQASHTWPQPSPKK